jgi:hypothetical protein
VPLELIPSSLCPNRRTIHIRTHGRRTWRDNRYCTQSTQIIAGADGPWSRARSGSQMATESNNGLPLEPQYPHLYVQNRGTIHQNARRQTWRQQSVPAARRSSLEQTGHGAGSPGAQLAGGDEQQRVTLGYNPHLYVQAGARFIRTHGDRHGDSRYCTQAARRSSLEQTGHGAEGWGLARKWQQQLGCRSGTIPSSLCPEAGARFVSRTHGVNVRNNESTQAAPQIIAGTDGPWARG